MPPNRQIRRHQGTGGGGGDHITGHDTWFLLEETHHGPGRAQAREQAMVAGAAHPHPHPTGRIGEQGDPGGARSHGAHQADQPARSQHRLALGHPLQRSAAQQQGVPPAGRVAGDHRCREPLRAGLLQTDQAPQAGVLGLQGTDAGRVLEAAGRAQPFGLGRARPEGTAEQGIGIGQACPLAQAHAKEGQCQQQPGPGLEQGRQGQGTEPAGRRHRIQVY